MNPSPLMRVLRTVAWVLAAFAGVAPVVTGYLTGLGVHVDGPASVAIAGVAVLVINTVVATFEKAGPVPVIRTVVQVVVALAALVPAVVAALANGNVHVDQAQLGAIAGLCVVVATVLQNFLEHLGVIPTLGAGIITADEAATIVRRSTAQHSEPDLVRLDVERQLEARTGRSLR